MDRDMIGHLVGPDNSNINKLRAKIQKVSYDLLYKYSLFPLNQHSENVKNAKNVICWKVYGNKNLTLDVIFLQVDPSAEIFADQIRGDVKLYGTEQSFETIESLVSAGDLYIFVGQYAVCVSQIIYHFEIMNIFFFLLLKLLHIEASTTIQ